MKYDFGSRSELLSLLESLIPIVPTHEAYRTQFIGELARAIHGNIQPHQYSDGYDVAFAKIPPKARRLYPPRLKHNVLTDLCNNPAFIRQVAVYEADLSALDDLGWWQLIVWPGAFPVLNLTIFVCFAIGIIGGIASQIVGPQAVPMAMAIGIIIFSVMLIVSIVSVIVMLFRIAVAVLCAIISLGVFAVDTLAERQAKHRLAGFVREQDITSAS